MSKGKRSKSSIKKKGALKKSLNTRKGKIIPKKESGGTSKASGKLALRARLALVLNKIMSKRKGKTISKDKKS